jgi:DNA uptake protein ComE-like DNA-binding protein
VNVHGVVGINDATQELLAYLLNRVGLSEIEELLSNRKIVKL